MVDGNIGAGKTTISRLISEKYDLQLYEELINKKTENILSRFYNDMTRWAFTLQIHFLNERFKMIKEAMTYPSIIDRSIYGDLVFAKVLHEDGHMTDEEYSVYRTLFSNMEPHFDKPDTLIYLNVSPEKALERIHKRGRESEQSIPLEYLQRLDREYENWLSTYTGKVKVFDYNRDDTYNEIINYVESLV